VSDELQQYSYTSNLATWNDDLVIPVVAQVAAPSGPALPPPPPPPLPKGKIHSYGDSIETTSISTLIYDVQLLDTVLCVLY
jgi:hypothetical protein